MTVEEMKSVDVRTVDRDSLVDVTQVRIDEGLTKEERLKEFVRQVGNPYCFWKAQTSQIYRELGG